MAAGAQAVGPQPAQQPSTMSNVAAAAEARVALLKTPFKEKDVIGGGEKQEGNFSAAEDEAIVALVRKHGSRTFTRMLIRDPVLQARTYKQIGKRWENMVKGDPRLKDLVAADAYKSQSLSISTSNGGFRALVIDADGGLSIVCFPPMTRAETKVHDHATYEYRIAKDLQGRGVKINETKVQKFIKINQHIHGGAFLHIVLPSPAEVAAAAASTSRPFKETDVIGGGEKRKGGLSDDEKAAVKVLVRKHKSRNFVRMVIDDPVLQGRQYSQLRFGWTGMIKADPSLENLLAADAPDPSKPTPRFLLYPANDSNGWDNAEHVPPSDPHRTLSEIKKELDSIKKRKGDAMRSGLLQPRLPPVDPDYPSKHAFAFTAKKAHVFKQMKDGTLLSSPVPYNDLKEEEKKNYEAMAADEVKRYEKAKEDYVPSHPAYRKEDGRRLDLVRAELPMMDPDLPRRPRYSSGWHKFAFRKGEQANLAKRSEEWEELGEDEKTALIEEVDKEWKTFNSLMKHAFDDYEANELYGNDGKLREKYWSHNQKLHHASGDSMFRLLGAPRVVVKGRRVPGAPKLPVRAFAYFCKSKSAKPVECSKIWNSLSAEEKHPFQLMAETDAIRYSREMDDFRDLLYQEEEFLRASKKLPSREAVTGKKRGYERKREPPKSREGRKKERWDDDMDVQEEKDDDDIETVAV